MSRLRKRSALFHRWLQSPYLGKMQNKGVLGMDDVIGRRKKFEGYCRYPLRRCYTLHECAVCKKEIVCDEIYYDGGYGRRAHEMCGFGWSPEIAILGEKGSAQPTTAQGQNADPDFYPCGGLR
jgi:hypothetical protein